jgi:hypothetical protein
MLSFVRVVGGESRLAWLLGKSMPCRKRPNTIRLQTSTFFRDNDDIQYLYNSPSQLTKVIIAKTSDIKRQAVMQPNKQNTRWEKTAADEKHKLKSPKKEIARYPILPRKCPQGDIKKP